MLPSILPSQKEVQLLRMSHSKTEKISMPSSIKPRRKKINWLPYQFLLPTLILLILINLYPFITGLIYSIREGSLIQLEDFVGLDNYIKLLQMPEFWNALQFSFLFGLFGVAGSYLIGLVLAVLLNKDVWGKGFFRVALLVPWIIPSVVSIVGWRWMIGDQHGLVNQMIGFLGMDPVNFLGTENGAIFSVILIKIWRSFPFMMVTILASLQTINTDLYEAAKIDGAGRWLSFRYITLPSIKMISIICCILMTIWCFNDFDTIWLLTQGGPVNATENLIILAYKYTFTKSDVGIGSAVSIFSLIILMILATIMLKFQEKE